MIRVPHPRAGWRRGRARLQMLHRFRCFLLDSSQSGRQAVAQWFFPGERDDRADNEDLDEEAHGSRRKRKLLVNGYQLSGALKCDEQFFSISPDSESRQDLYDFISCVPAFLIGKIRRS